MCHILLYLFLIYDKSILLLKCFTSTRAILLMSSCNRLKLDSTALYYTFLLALRFLLCVFYSVSYHTIPYGSVHHYILRCNTLSIFVSKYFEILCYLDVHISIRIFQHCLQFHFFRIALNLFISG